MPSREAASRTGELTLLIDRMDRGDAAAHAEFCEQVYAGLRDVAHRMRSRIRVDSLESADLVQDLFGAWLRDARLSQMKNRRYFYKAAADQIHRMLVDHVRHKATRAAGGQMNRVDGDACLDALAESTTSRCGGNLESINAALDKLKTEDSQLHEIVRLKFFAGMTIEQIAETREVSVDTVKRHWRQARDRLKRLLNADF